MSSLISVNVGLPRDIEWRGKTVRTAIWKRPVQGRVMARRLNIEGDGQGDLAGHGGEQRAVMVYQLDSYRYWQNYLGRQNFEYGQFGENFTVEGLSDNEVCIGDRYRIGSALFEVTQPRVTCYRVGIRMETPQMPALLVSHKRPGFYLRILEEGEIGAGDEIVKVSDGPERFSVADTDALLYLPGHSRDQLNRALRIPALSSGWKQSFTTMLDAETVNEQVGNAGLAPSTGPPSAWQGFQPMRVTAVQRESLDVLSFTFEPQTKQELPLALPGQFLALKLEVEKNSPPVLRSYSISGPQQTTSYRISLKRGSGPGSRYLHDHIHTGDILQISAPRGSFLLEPGDSPVVLLSAGIGATPVLSMLHTLAAANSNREVWWCYGARNGTQHPFASEVQNLLKALPRSHSFIAYSKPEASDQAGKDYDIAGHLNLSELQKLSIPRNADFYLCGPTVFLDEFTQALESWGVKDASIHTEIFGSGPSITPGISSTKSSTPHPPAGEPGTGPAISFTRSGFTEPWNPRFASLLEFAEACDIPVRWSCRVGVCHTCESALIDGQVRYSPEPLDRPAQGNVLICCSTPLTQIELDL